MCHFGKEKQMVRIPQDDSTSTRLIYSENFRCEETLLL